MVLGEEDLIEDLMRAQVALESQRTGQAESTIERAADLRGQAEGEPVLVGNEHTFDLIAVGQREHKFFGAILRRKDLDRRSPFDTAAARQVLPVLLREIAHLGERAGTFLIEPAQDLRRAIGRPSE